MLRGYYKGLSDAYKSAISTKLLKSIFFYIIKNKEKNPGQGKQESKFKTIIEN